MHDTVVFMGIYNSGVPRFCRCVCTFCFVCVFGGGGEGGVEVFPTPPNKEKRPWKCTHCVLCVLLVTPLIIHGLFVHKTVMSMAYFLHSNIYAIRRCSCR